MGRHPNNTRQRGFLLPGTCWICFFFAGHFIKKLHLLEGLGTTPFKRLLEGTLGGTALILLWFTCKLNRPVWMYINFYGNPMLFYLNAVLGCLGTLLLAHAIDKNPFFEYLGRYSLLILLQHFFFLCIFPWLWHKLGVTPIVWPWLSFPLNLSLASLTSPFISKHLPLLAGKKLVPRS